MIWIWGLIDLQAHQEATTGYAERGLMTVSGPETHYSGGKHGAGSPIGGRGLGRGCCANQRSQTVPWQCADGS